MKNTCLYSLYSIGFSRILFHVPSSDKLKQFLSTDVISKKSNEKKFLR